MQTVEEERLNRQVAAQGCNVLAAAEPAHRRLARQWATVAVEGDHFPVEDEVRHRHGGDRLDNFRDARGDIVVLAREHRHVGPRLVHLHARAVHLGVEKRASHVRDGIADLGRGLREHRLHGGADSQADTAQAGFPLGHRDVRDAGQVSLQHVGMTHAGGTAARRLGDGFDHDAVERALPHVTD